MIGCTALCNLNIHIFVNTVTESHSVTLVCVASTAHTLQCKVHVCVTVVLGLSDSGDICMCCLFILQLVQVYYVNTNVTTMC